MTIEQVDKIISDLRNQIPSLQMQLHQAEGYRQALVDLEKPEEEEKEETKVKQMRRSS